MRRLFLAALGMLAVAGVASAQPPVAAPPPPPAPAYAPPPVHAGSGTAYVMGGGGCALGAPCANGCGSLKSDLAFHFGSCKNFFSPCGPTYGGHGHCGGLFGHGGKCPTLPFAQPWGPGWCCPRPYDSYANH